MKELLPDIERWREAGQKVAIATVVQAYGSAPRRAGAKMAIADAATCQHPVLTPELLDELALMARRPTENDSQVRRGRRGHQMLHDTPPTLILVIARTVPPPTILDGLIADGGRARRRPCRRSV